MMVKSYWPVLIKDKRLSWESIKKNINDSVATYTNTLIKNNSNIKYKSESIDDVKIKPKKRDKGFDISL
jgi:hypothetical protein